MVPYIAFNLKQQMTFVQMIWAIKKKKGYVWSTLFKKKDEYKMHFRKTVIQNDENEIRSVALKAAVHNFLENFSAWIFSNLTLEGWSWGHRAAGGSTLCERIRAHAVALSEVGLWLICTRLMAHGIWASLPTLTSRKETRVPGAKTLGIRILPLFPFCCFCCVYEPL